MPSSLFAFRYSLFAVCQNALALLADLAGVYTISTSLPA